jgi:PAS domain S-box-containing protein
MAFAHRTVCILLKWQIVFFSYRNQFFMSIHNDAGNSSEMPDELFDQNNIKQFVALFNYATIGIVITDKRGVIINFNKYIENQFGYTKAEVLGKMVEILLPQSIHKKHEAYREKFYQHPQNRVMGAGRDLYARKKDGTEFPVEVSLSHYSLNNEEFVIAFVVDITLRKNSEEFVLQQRFALKLAISEAHKINEELEQKVVERTMMLKETLAELEKSKEVINKALTAEKKLGELKSMFVTIASHEFRTPLSAILTSFSLIEKYTTTEEQAKRERHIIRGKEAVYNMRNILEDFLSIGKLEEGEIKAQFAQFDLKELLNHVIDEAHSLLKPGQKFIYHHTGRLNVLLDPSLLKNIIINLISNAIKFSPEGAVIIIKSHVENDKFQLSVKDDGIGISEEDQEHLYERFFRAKNALDIQGTGLGLYIVVKYLRMMGGVIKCKTELNRGTEFMIEFDKKLIPGLF